MRGAIVGAGFFAQFHADAWQRMPEAEIVSVVDADSERAREFAGKWEIPHTHGTIDELLSKEKLDFVDIVTRPDTHLPLTRIAASQGVNIICQKPMAPSVAECEEMVRVCDEKGVRLVIHENWRWQPWYRQMRVLIDRGRFGPVFHLGVTMRTGDGRGDSPYPAQPYFKEMPRLLIYETLVHYLDTFRYLGGDIESVYCRTRRINPVIAGEDYAVVQVRFRSGAEGLIDANRIAGPMPPPVAFGEFRLEGEFASVRMNGEGDLWIRENGQTAEVVYDYEKTMTGYKGDSVLAMQRHFIHCLNTGKPAESEGREYLKTVKAVEACYQSAYNGLPQVIA